MKCGAPAEWPDCHHIVHWQEGGPTTLENGCLLCRTCHRAVHNTDWDVVMGPDRHPWLLPPADVDPLRKPLPAYNRRTLTLAA
ncbi:HNH endonuclease signature motif containing protein [Williamsia sp. DF01-3]|uniref:HNH endonuclease signature motif containing protein n=1 Tax=Williamsia sp. DF01-3 TaxID=2934157 RepID=UPI001FF53E38|nr:HNH endonuclease signature motif containing protein [Williamsia sp. DF01-3]MCK0519551.1 HNH endonuclease [Williamsia sp. DF01-3]